MHSSFFFGNGDHDPDDQEALVFSVVSFPPLLPALATIVLVVVVNATQTPQSQTAGQSHSEICWVVWSKYVVFWQNLVYVSLFEALGVLMVK